MSSEVITITEQPIELCKLLKIANMVSGGGEAKIVISEGYVLLNGEVEFRKRKKVVDGDIIEFNGETLTVQFDQVASSQIPSQKIATSSKKTVKNSNNNNNKKTPKETVVETPVKAKRKPISF